LRGSVRIYGEVGCSDFHKTSLSSSTKEKSEDLFLYYIFCLKFHEEGRS
jgi:hypothetical protein